MKKKKGQAAMEYLMTYAWAILVIILVLAIIIYLRIFEIGSKIPERCDFGSGLLCTSAKVTPTSLLLKLKSGFNRPISICNLVCDNSKTPGAIDLGGADGACTSALASLDVGEEKLVGPVTSGCSDSSGTIVPVGMRYQGKLFLTYYLAGDSGNPRVIPGLMEAVVQPS
ncbi:MAG: hypothetical protein Q7T16_03360 [Candidatus Burarchaeum sp.]|nr:hypothetical protein [Candidatus Burarchaeum sp.]MDO8339670.1 hypothetical protein [Candidatus Burarchaeum sp.]